MSGHTNSPLWHSAPTGADRRSAARTYIRGWLSAQITSGARAPDVLAQQGWHPDVNTMPMRQLSALADAILNSGDVPTMPAELAHDIAPRPAPRPATPAPAPAPIATPAPAPVAAVTATGVTATADTDATPAAQAEGDTPTTDNEHAPDPDKVKAAVAAVFAPLAVGDAAGAAKAAEELARAALTPRIVTRTVTVEKIVKETIPAPAIQAGAPIAAGAPVPAYHAGRRITDPTPLPVSVGAATAGKVFPPLRRKPWDKVGDGVSLTRYNPTPRTPRLDPNFVWPVSDQLAMLAIASASSMPVFLTGPRGVGKTTLAQQWAAVLGREFVRIACRDTTDAIDFEGADVPDGAGGVIWKDGQLASAIRRPGTVILIDEPSAARAGALLALQSVLDRDRTLHIDRTGESIAMAQDVQIWLADNTNGQGDATGLYAGTDRLSGATLDRPLCMLSVEPLAPDIEARMVVARTHCHPDVARMVVGLATASRTSSVAEGALAEGLSPRRVLALAYAVRQGMPWGAALQHCVLTACSPVEREHLAQLAQAKIDARAMDKLAGLSETDPAPADPDAPTASATGDDGTPAQPFA